MLPFVIKGVYKRIFICIKMHMQKIALEWYIRNRLLATCREGGGAGDRDGRGAFHCMQFCNTNFELIELLK